MMKQNVIYRLFLIIGSILLMNSSCEKLVEQDVLTKYQYINNSGKQLQMKVFSSRNGLIKDNEISVGDTLTLEIITEGGAAPFQFETNHGDSIYLNFANERYQIYRKDYDSIFFEKAYNKTKLSDQEFQLFYIFTTKDYNNAEPINE